MPAPQPQSVPSKPPAPAGLPEFDALRSCPAFLWSRDGVRLAAGAVGGAVAGALLWWGIEALFHWWPVWGAALAGVLAGVGATLVSRHRGLTIGAVAAVAGILGSLGGGYLASRAHLGSPDVLARIEAAYQQAAADLPEFHDMTPEEHQAALESFRRAYLASDMASFGSIMSLSGHRWLSILTLCGAAGVLVGFRLGCGPFRPEPAPPRTEAVVVRSEGAGAARPSRP